MNDDLDTLSDDKLSELFAVEVAGYRRFDTADCGVIWKDPEGAVAVARTRQRFATDANAVLPYAQRLKKFHVYWDDFKMIVAEPTPSYHIDFAGRCWVRNAPTLARALCIALIRHARVSRGHKSKP